MTSTFAQMLVTNVMDATRISDGKLVSLKRVKSSSQEIVIASLLSSEELRKDPRNHCVPIPDVFSSEDDHLDFIVMPLLVKFWTPRFSSVNEVLDFMRQMLEVLPLFFWASVKVRLLNSRRG